MKNSAYCNHEASRLRLILTCESSDEAESQRITSMTEPTVKLDSFVDCFLRTGQGLGVLRYARVPFNPILQAKARDIGLEVSWKQAIQCGISSRARHWESWRGLLRIDSLEGQPCTDPTLFSRCSRGKIGPQSSAPLKSFLWWKQRTDFWSTEPLWMRSGTIF